MRRIYDLKRVKNQVKGFHLEYLYLYIGYLPLCNLHLTYPCISGTKYLPSSQVLPLFAICILAASGTWYLLISIPLYLQFSKLITRV